MALVTYRGGRRSILFGDLPQLLQANTIGMATLSICPPAPPVWRAAACAQQAFLYDQRVLGLQFHFRR
ncbi:MAG: hypothetical protein R2864_05415 [Syntrophotaleaceae bacterium]